MPTLSFQPLSAPTAPDFHPRPRLSSQEPWRRIRVARLNPGIPEQLCGSSTSVMLRPGDERREWEGNALLNVFSPRLSKTTQSFYAMLCSFIPLTVSAHRSHVCVREEPQIPSEEILHFCLSFAQSASNCEIFNV